MIRPRLKAFVEGVTGASRMIKPLVRALLDADGAAVRQMLDDNPSRISEARPSGRRPLSAAIAASIEHQQRDKIAKFFDDGIGLDHS